MNDFYKKFSTPKQYHCTVEIAKNKDNTMSF